MTSSAASGMTWRRSGSRGLCPRRGECRARGDKDCSLDEPETPWAELRALLRAALPISAVQLGLVTMGMVAREERAVPEHPSWGASGVAGAARSHVF